MTHRTSQRRRTPLTATLLLAALGLVGITLNGCVLFEGVHMPDDDGESTAQSRVEVELIKNAKLKTEDTRPHWPHGRYVYDKGVDRLLVISNITSYEKGGQRFDKWLERVWITIPFEAKIGKPMDLDKLDQQFLVGYDRADLENLGAGFAFPLTITGKLVVLNDTGDAMDIQLDMKVRPKDLLPWEYHGKARVTALDKGVRAVMAKSYQLASAKGSGADTGDPKGDDGKTGAGDSGTGDTPDPLNDAKKAREKLTGKWVGEGKEYQMLLQLGDGEKFVFASRREGDAPPVMKFGTWKLHQDNLVLYIRRYEISGVSQMQFLRTPMMVFRYEPRDDNKLLLQGDTRDREGSISLLFDATNFPDLAQKLPPNGRKPWGDMMKGTDKDGDGKDGDAKTTDTKPDADKPADGEDKAATPDDASPNDAGPNDAGADSKAGDAPAAGSDADPAN